jgi:hypothetical protein
VSPVRFFGLVVRHLSSSSSSLSLLTAIELSFGGRTDKTSKTNIHK